MKALSAQIAPAMWSEAPPMNLVMLCTTMSAPSGCGLISSGLKVLSITSMRPWRCAISASAGMSAKRSVGLAMLSA